MCRYKISRTSRQQNKPLIWQVLWLLILLDTRLSINRWIASVLHHGKNAIGCSPSLVSLRLCCRDFLRLDEALSRLFSLSLKTWYRWRLWPAVRRIFPTVLPHHRAAFSSVWWHCGTLRGLVRWRKEHEQNWLLLRWVNLKILISCSIKLFAFMLNQFA